VGSADKIKEEYKGEVLKCDQWRQGVCLREIGGNNGCAAGVAGLRKMSLMRHIIIVLTGTV